jgi:hypothetical protein
LSDIYYFPTITSFILDFERYDPTKYVWPVVQSCAIDAFRSDLLCFFLTTFTFSRHGLLRSPMGALSLRNLQSRCEDHVTDSPGFSGLVNNLHALELSFLTVEHERGRPHNRPIGPQSWDFYTTLPQVWLAPARRLTKLRLSANSHWGYYPKVDFRNVNFGSLKTLILDCFTFSHDWQQVWLLRHCTTLTHLVLSRCSILRDALCIGYLDQEGYPTGLRTGLPTESATYTYNTGWSDYLNAMSDSLTELHYFSMVGENQKSAVAEEMTIITHADRYLDFKSGLYSAVIDRTFRGGAVDLSSRISQMAIAGPVSLNTNHLLAMSRQYQEDAQALRNFLNKIAQRNMAIGK